MILLGRGWLICRCLLFKLGALITLDKQVCAHIVTSLIQSRWGDIWGRRWQNLVARLLIIN